MKEDLNKTNEQLSFELNELRNKSKEREEILKAANQQLSATEQQLRAANQQLDANNQQLIASEQQLRVSNLQLIERLKELDCFYGISKILEIPNISLDEITRRLVDLIPASWQYPEIAVCRIILNGIEYKTQNFRKTNWSQCSDIFIDGKHTGNIEVCYLKEMPDSDEGVFLKEERLLINVIAKRLEKIIQRKQSEGLQKAVNQQLQATNQQLSATEQQLRANNQQLTASEKKFKSYIENAPDGVFIVNEKGEYIELNDAACKITGYTKKELLKLTIHKLIQQEYLEKAKNHFQTVLKDGAANAELGYVMKSGEKRYWSIEAVKLSNTRFLGFAKDITEQKRAENILQISELKYRNQANFLNIVIENSPFAMWISDADGTMIRANQALKNILNVSDDMLIGKYNVLKDENLRKQGILSDTISVFKELKTTRFTTFWKASEVGDINLATTETDEFWLDASMFPITDETGKLTNVICQYVDITKIKKAEKALKESEEKFRYVLSNSVTTIYNYNLNTGTYDYLSPAVKEMYGFPPEEFISEGLKGAINRFHPDDYERIENHLEKLLSKKVEDFTPTVEYRFNHPKLGYRWISDTRTIIFDEKGNPKSLIGNAYDITDTKIAEEALKESEEKMNSIFRVAPTGIGVVKDRVLIEVNPRICEITGYSKNELLGKSARILYPTKEEHEYVGTEKYHQIAESGTGTVETRWLKKDGSIINILLSSTPINIDNYSAGITFTALDITKRKLAEEELKATNQQFEASNQQLSATEQQLRAANIELAASEKRFRKYFEQSMIGMTITSVNKEWIEINDVLCKMLGYSKEELLEMTWTELTHTDDLEAELIQFNKMLANEIDSYVLEKRFNHKQGHIVYTAVSVNAYRDTDNLVEYVLAIVHNITEQKQAEENLKESEIRFKALHNASFGGIAIHNKGIILECNNGLSEMTDHNVDDLIGMDGLLLIAEESREMVMENILSAYEKPYEAIGIRKNGKKYPLRLEARQIPYKGKYVRVVEFRDITESKKKEEEISKLSTAVKQSPSVIAITDTKGDLEYINPKFTEITGYSLEEAKGNNPRILKSGTQSDEMFKELWKTISLGKEWRGEFHNKKKNGELFWESASVSPIFDEYGKIINYVKVGEDITQRKRTGQIQKVLYNISNAVSTTGNLDELIKRIQEELGTIIDTTNFYIALYDNKTDTLSLPFFKDEKDVFTSFPAGKTLTYYVIKTQKSLLATKEKINKLENSGEVESYGEDSEIWLGVPLKVEGKVTGVIAIQSYTDENAYNESDKEILEFISYQISISLERKKAEQDLKLALENAQESDRLKSAFLSNMSHEIRTPMNGILGFTDLLKEPQLSGEEMDKYIQIIEKSGNRMLNTINDIIDISKVEAGQVELIKAEVSINKVLEELYHFFKREAKAKGLELLYKPVLSDKDTCIVTDKHKLEGILSNLIKNAIKFTERGNISFGCLLKKEKSFEGIEFYIKDTGIGIPSDRIKAIFNRFEQADIEDARAFEGSGLGLAISKSYVEMLGGNISVTSEEDIGSTFIFTIPYTKQGTKKCDSKGSINKDQQASLKKLSVIVAEDDDASRLLLKAVFGNKFQEIIFTKTGKETVEKFRENPEINLILMDLKMPVMSGYEATREIRKFNQDVVIIAQTAYGLSGDREKAIEAGCDDHITKPIKQKLLVELINKHVK